MHKNSIPTEVVGGIKGCNHAKAEWFSHYAQLLTSFGIVQ